MGSYKKALYLITILCLSVFFNAVSAEQVMRLESAETVYRPGFVARYLEDPLAELKPRHLRQAMWQESFLPTRGSWPGFGLSQSAWWLTFILDNQSKNTEVWWLDIGYAPLDSLELYVLNPSGYPELVGKSGDLSGIPKAYRSTGHGLFKLDITTGTRKTYFLRVQSDSFLMLPIKLVSTDQLLTSTRIESLFKGIFYGGLLVLIAYNLLLFTAIRDTSYLLYVFYSLMIFLNRASVDGLALEFFWPGAVEFNGRMPMISLGLALMLGLMFMGRFLKTAYEIPWLKQILYGFYALLSGYTLLSLFGELRLGVWLSGPIMMLCFALVVAVAVWCLWQGDRAARFFLAAWLALMLGAMINVSASYSWLPVNLFTLYSGHIGAGIEAVLLSLGLAERISRDRHLKANALQKQRDMAQELQRAEERMIQQAFSDHLTGLPNRASLVARMRSLTLIGGRYQLVLLQPMRYQQIKNTLGHEQAAKLLVSLAGRISNLLRDYPGVLNLDRPARDAAIAVLEGPALAFIVRTRDQLERIEKRLQKLQQPQDIGGMRLDPGLRVGVSSFPEHASHPELLLQYAHVAVEQAEANNSFLACYQAEQDPYSERHLTLLADLSHAIKRSQLVLAYQPQCDLDSERIIGVEALLRWRHPKNGWVSPAEFIPMAEQGGMMRELTHWLMEVALRQLGIWRERGIDISMSLNLSAQNLLEPDLPERFSRLLDKYRLNPKQLILEITETTMMSDPDQALIILSKFHELGIQLSIDDFGTGYSSMAYLRKLPVNEIKIDRSFVVGMVQEKQDALIVKTITVMSHNLNLKVVAEGVEDLQTMRLLRKIGCDVAQGWFIGRPVSASEIERLMLQLPDVHPVAALS
ncbi:EAL domain-containing protein [Pelagibaculum spongiae]|uniref:EAL domain-containing protein n=1 Tax=Pelagibaculum spongiae TaxID=2080658 RepID=A0A2V1GVA5_9GAMM|nr:EAL domain-containing protein [Pelagibaculum spongiae]PVZ68271.1 hypothetical protein DC094_13345 [Pelagibaculum spongiae]